MNTGSHVTLTAKDELGMLLGLHAGDALGATLEFSPARAQADWLKEIVGGGPFQIAKGAGTDDTDMMIAVLSSLQSRTEFSVSQCLNAFLTWLETGPKDVGMTTRSNLILQKRGLEPEIREAGQGNGSLMRCAPLALMNLPHLELMRIVSDQCRLTHPHPHCVLTDQIFVSLLQSILKGERSKDGLLELAVSLSSQNQELKDLIRGIRTRPWAAVKTTGYVFDTLSAALWALYHTESFEDALVQIVNRGDDSDTVGAVTGALCGAYYGLEGIPKRWRELLRERAKIEDLFKLLS